MKILKLILLIISLLVVSGSWQPVGAETGTVAATVRPNPLTVDLSVPAIVSVDQWFDVTANISNLGQETITSTQATLNTPAEVTVRQNKKRVGDLQGLQTKTVSWQVKVRSSGNFVIQVEVAGNLTGEVITASDSEVIQGVSTLAHLLRRLIFGV